MTEKSENYLNMIEKRLNESDIQQPSELGEVVKHMNDDTQDDDGMTSLDMRTRLNDFEINGMLCNDTLVRMGALPWECLSLPRQKKRLAVSRNGLGRKEFCEVVTGRQQAEIEKSGGMFSSYVNKWLKPKKTENVG